MGTRFHVADFFDLIDSEYLVDSFGRLSQSDDQSVRQPARRICGRVVEVAGKEHSRYLSIVAFYLLGEEKVLWLAKRHLTDVT